ncbi:oxysterol-binding protein-related protein 2-like [Amphibalanus amphitrite]|uniref:oxysterol-binding protein-related protein 2-like n=1 Tax=Amphibalanus amphitrite TaxID=1232801 RepID=UPI001C91FFBE|nr:oxysterol-binding protein-related protein 2-like [Amphibalanus amphitrite]
MSDHHPPSDGRRYRSRLPREHILGDDFNMWSVLKGGIGKELTKVPMPVSFNEPLSFLQRMAELMEYSELLQLAAGQEDSVSRMELVAAFAVSGLACNWGRTAKPFNPLLGETYELERNGFRMVCEQVSHHPPVTAFHAEGDQYQFHGSVHPKLKFLGRSLEISPRGTLAVELPGHEETYTWSNVNCYVHNVVVGKLWVEQQGTMTITNHKTGDTCTLVFKSSSSSKSSHRVEGFIQDRMKTRHRFLYGKWTEYLRSMDIESYENNLSLSEQRLGSSQETERRAGLSPIHGPRKMFSRLNSITTAPFRSHSDRELNVEHDSPDDLSAEGALSRSSSGHSLGSAGSRTLWQAEPPPVDAHKYYHFTRFAMSLNELLPDMELCRTDSRLRPDIRALESGDTEKAGAEKARLEDKQRRAGKARSKRKQAWTPRYFQLCKSADTNIEDWTYMNNFWEEKNTTDVDIF